MRIIVPIKQVPETDNVQMDPETGTMLRAGVETVVNPLDLYAIECALRLTETHGGIVTAISMGPPQAERALREAIAMGCDKGILVSDKRFGGADTWATSYTLAQAIRQTGDYDLIIAGERATDGDTAQVGPGIAAWMGLPVATYVARIDGIDGDTITVERLVEEGYQIVQLSRPAVLTVVKEIAAPRLPTLRGKIRARSADIPVFSTANLELDRSAIGLSGSPTRVVKIESPKVLRKGTVVNARDDGEIADAVAGLVRFLDAKNLV